MRGKVVIKFKTAGNTPTAVFDDYDEDNDIVHESNVNEGGSFHKDENEVDVHGLETDDYADCDIGDRIFSDDEASQHFGIETLASIISDTHFEHNKSLAELEADAENEMQKAKAESESDDLTQAILSSDLP